MVKREKIYCPYCGPWNGEPEGVPMEARPVIVPVAPGIKENRRFWCCECPVCRTRSPLCSTEKQAISAAMRRFKPPKRPLEFGELRPGDVVWVEEPGKDPYCVHLVYWRRSDDPETRKPSIPIEKHGLEGSTYFKPDQYGKKWRCWRKRPTYDERAAAAWEE